IPVALTGRDVVATAQTGTGKTAAFCIPMLTRLLADPLAYGLVLVPTRELALQIHQFWKELTRFTPRMNAVSLIGGAPFGPQVKFLRQHARVVIATPGRLIDHLERRTVNLFNVRMLVLDEADRMLDMGFAPQLAVILKSVPQERQTMLFSATWDPALHDIARKHLVNPARISVGEVSRAASTVTQKIVQTTVKDKNETLLDEINKRPQGSMLIFARTQARTDRLAKYLLSYGLDVGLIHGGRSQGQRNSALAGFKNGNTRILVATDIAARGIDVADIAYVVNYDIPMAPEDYVHRIGRTGRAGTVGQALSLLVAEDRSLWNGIVRLLKMTGSALPEGVTATIRSNGEAQVSGVPTQMSARHRKPSLPRGSVRGGQGGGAPLANSTPSGHWNQRNRYGGHRKGQQPRPAQNYAASSAISSEVEALPWRPKYRDLRSY
ncbi:MAG: DEAD/DEAH box helicase, partial [Bdellovibrionota bacterium]